MTDKMFTRDPALGAALAEATHDLSDERVDWAGLRSAISARASVELTRRRARRRRVLIAIPASLAAGIALFVLVSRAPGRSDLGVPANSVAGAETSIDELLGVNVSDGQFRALLSGANDADDLLAIAAGEGQP